MRPTRLWRLLPGAALILLSAGSSLAMTLGRAQGMTLIGRPLDVTVPVVLDAGSDPADLCPGAEVFYGESRVDAPVVSLRSTGRDAAVLRVQVPRAVDEAFVTVQVRVGCTQMLSRRFVLLTEDPVETAQAAAQPTPVAPAVIAPPTALPVGGLEPAPAAGASAAAASSVAAGTAAAAPSAASAAAPVRRARPARVAAAERPAAAARRPAPVTRQAAPAPAPAAVERPRLKLDAADLAPAAAPAAPAAPARLTPVASPPAASPAAGDATQRADAAAQEQTSSPAQAQAPGVPPDDLLRNAERMVTLEADIRAMREGMLKNQAMLAELRGRLEQAEGERYANGLVYALAALLAAACGLAGLFWHRSRRAAAVTSSWWAERSQLTVGHAVTEPPLSEPQPWAVAAGTVPAPAPATREMPSTLPAVLPLASARGDERAAAGASTGLSAPESDVFEPGFLASEAGDLPAVAASPVKLDELSDLQQQVEFFVSLGEYERAIAALRENIDAQPQASTIAWLELLDLYHRLGRETEYEQLRRDYEWVFSDQLPAFAAYADDARGIEAHADAMARIQSLWHQPAILELIERTVLRTPRRDGEPAMGLQALRDLLMLHGVAAELGSTAAQPEPSVKAEAGAGARVSPMFTAAPVVATATVATATATAAAAAAALAESHVGDPGAAEAYVARSDAASLDVSSIPALSLDPLPNEEWKKLAAPNSRPAGLDLNLDDLDHPPSTDTLASALGGRQHGNLLDFDLDLSEEFKLPKR